MKYSIIIPCYNEKHTIIEIVKRVKLNGLREQEIIIIDDNSTDGTKKILESKISKIKNVKILFNNYLNLYLKKPISYIHSSRSERWQSG